MTVVKDFGQKLHGMANCSVCGMTYVRCEPVDELTHSQYHQTVLATLKFSVSGQLACLVFTEQLWLCMLLRHFFTDYTVFRPCFAV